MMTYCSKYMLVGSANWIRFMIVHRRAEYDSDTETGGCELHNRHVSVHKRKEPQNAYYAAATHPRFPLNPLNHDMCM
jgi:hypothetical protein